MAQEHVSVLISLRDMFTAEARRVQREADKTGDSLRDMDRGADRGSRGLARADEKAKGLHTTLGRLVNRVTGFNQVLANIKIPAFLTLARLAITALSAMTAATTALVGASMPLVGIFAAYPGFALALGSAMGTVKLATGGLDDAIKVLGKTDATAKEVKAALDPLAPEARRFAVQLVKMRPILEQLRKSAARGLFPGLSASLTKLVELAPLASRFLERMGGALGGVAMQLTGLFTGAAFKADLGTILARNVRIVEFLGQALVHLVDGLRHFMVAAGPFIELLARGAAEAAKNAARFLEMKRNSGELAEFFAGSLRTLRGWKDALKDLFIGLYNVFSIGARWGGEMGRSLGDVSRRFREWTESASGVEKITAWFDRARPVMEAFGRLALGIAEALGTLGGQTSGVVRTVDAVTQHLVPAITAIATGFDDSLGPTMVNLATAVVRFFNLLTFQPLIDLATWFAKTADAVLTFVERLSPTARTVLASMLAVTRLTGALGLLWKVMGGRALMKFAGYVRGSTAALAGHTVATNASKSATAAHAAMTRVKAIAAIIAYHGYIIATTVATKLWTAAQWLLNIAFTSFVVERAKGLVLLVAHKVKTVAVAVATKLWAAAQWLLNAALLANPIGLVIAAIALLVTGIVVLYRRSEGFRSVVQAVWEWMKRWWQVGLILLGPLGLIAGALITLWQRSETFRNAVKSVWDWLQKLGSVVMGAFRSAINWMIDRWDDLRAIVEKVVGALRSAWEWAGKAKDKVGDFVTGRGGWLSRGVSWVNPLGDTARPRAGSGGGGGGIGRTLATHAAVEAMTPGARSITNVFRGAFAGSDHHRGLALDLKGPNLNTYMRNLRAVGGFAEHHGSGTARHLHAAYPAGDTVRPRAPAGTAAPAKVTTLEMHGPLIGQVIASSDVDVERAAISALEKWIRERNERR